MARMADRRKRVGLSTRRPILMRASSATPRRLRRCRMNVSTRRLQISMKASFATPSRSKWMGASPSQWKK